LQGKDLACAALVRNPQAAWGHSKGLVIRVMPHHPGRVSRRPSPQRLGARLVPAALGCLLLAAAGRAAHAPTAPPVISLAGTWRSELDPGGMGLQEQWFARELKDSVRLPGSTDENHKGTPNTRPPDLNGLSRLYEYVGPAWYERDVEIPAAWQGRRVILFLERCHWETQAWLDGKPRGMQDSLCVPHVHELGVDVAPGRHRLTLRIDNSHKYNMGGAAHSTSDQTQTNWNGVVGRVELRATPSLWLGSVQVYPDIRRKSVRVSAALEGETRQGFELVLQVTPRGGGKPVAGCRREGKALIGPQTVEADLTLGKDARLWDESSPALYDVRATLTVRTPSGPVADSLTTTFGLRELKVRDRRMVLNDRRIFLRGTLECCVFPLTGYPPTDAGPWLRLMRIAKSYGLNHLRFHSWCPPEAAFAAADEMGFLLHVEAPQWVGNVGQDPPRDRFIEEEVLRILAAYGNHPSFGMLCLGNELSGDTAFLERVVRLARERDGRHLYTSSTAWSFTPADDYNVAAVRGLHGPSTSADFREPVARSGVPLVSHEVGQWTVFPRLAEMAKYTGVLRARNFGLVRDGLKAHNLLDQAEQFTWATGRLAAELYKEEIEVLLRTPGHGGFQLLDLHDFPGQGTALVGVLDAFWDPKGVTTPEAHRRYCGPTVPLLRLPKRTYTADERVTAEAEVAHFGPTDLAGAQPVWTVTDEAGRKVASGTLPRRDLPTGDLHRLGAVSFGLRKTAAPCRLTVTLSLAGTEARNDWHLWVYPAEVDTAPPDDLLVTRSTAEALDGLKAGRKVLLLASVGSLVRSRAGSFTPVFWSPAWFPQQAAGTMSILCDPRHPALAAFPTEAYTNWQWYDLLTRSRSMVLDDTPANFRPIVQVVDNFTRNHKLGNLLEARAGDGRLMVCSINLWQDLERRPEARQLLHSILRYCGSPGFQPRQRLSFDELASFLCERGPSVLQTLGAKVVMADSEDRQSGNVAPNALDGLPETFWHTQWQGAEPPYPHEIQVDLQRPVEMAGFRYLPRQDMQNGWFTEYEVYLSEDGKQWGQPVAKGTFAPDSDEKVVQFDKPRRGRFLRLRALRGVAGRPWAAIAELDIIPVGQPPKPGAQ